jgi:3-deoxy-D-manno-octulosonic acid kinase
MTSIHCERRGRCTLVFDRHFFSELDPARFHPAFWQSLNAISGQESGRGTTWFIRDGDHQLVLRHYLRGGWVARFNRDRYLFTGWRRCRAIAEFDILQQARELGLPVPRPAAAMSVRHGLFHRNDILLERIDGARDLKSVLQVPQLPEFHRRLGQTLARFHRAGILHADLNIKNILCDAQGAFWLIDFDRARRVKQMSQAQERRVLERLQRSFIKETGRSGIQWNPSDWTYLIKGYRTGMSD